jgi:hypothetical protein
LGSPAMDWLRRVDRRCRRRAAAADRWWRGRGHSNYGEDRGGAGQRVARVASLGPRGCAEMVGWLGDRAKGRARRWLPGGSLGSSNSGELAARPEQHAQGRATGGPSGVRSSTCLRRKASGGGVHRVAPMADGGGTVLARGEEVAAFIAVLKAVREVSLRTKGTKSWHGPRHGRSTARGGGGDVRRVRRLAVGWAARRGYGSTAAHGREACGAKEEGRNGGSTAHGPAGRSRPRCAAQRGRGAGGARHRRDGVRYGRQGSNHFD